MLTLNAYSVGVFRRSVEFRMNNTWRYARGGTPAAWRLAGDAVNGPYCWVDSSVAGLSPTFT